MRAFLHRLWRDRSGAAAIEYAFVLPVFAMLVLGSISAAQLLHAANSLHYAVEEASRCLAVNAVLCPTPASAAAYARGKYMGPDIGAAFAAADTACGPTVTASGSYPLQVAVAVIDVPLSASACYPAAAAQT